MKESSTLASQRGVALMTAIVLALSVNHPSLPGKIKFFFFDGRWLMFAAGVLVIGAALLGTGFVLMRGGHGASGSHHDGVAPAKSCVAVLPLLGTRGGALDLRVTF